MAKRSAGVPSAIGRQNLNDEELVNKTKTFEIKQKLVNIILAYSCI